MYKCFYSFLVVSFLFLIPWSSAGPNRTCGGENRAAGDNPCQVASADSVSEVSVNLVGDLMCHMPQVNNASLGNGEYDFNPAFGYIKPYLEDADWTLGNLETTFAGPDQPYSGYPAFNTPDAFCTALKNAGFDLLVTANNHSMDTREAGLLRTLEVLRQNHLRYTGTFTDQQDHDSIRILTKNGISIAVLNYTYGTNGAYPAPEHKFMLNLIDSAQITDDVRTAKKRGADLVLVFFHWGQENVTEPEPAQKEAARFAVEAGATAIIGSHAHMIGPVAKMYSGSAGDTAWIAYSLGNFLSNQYWRYTDAGVILKLIIQKNYTTRLTRVKEATVLPTWVYRGDGTRKAHIILPAQWGTDTTRLPDFITPSHQQKMTEAWDDTRKMMQGLEILDVLNK